MMLQREQETRETKFKRIAQKAQENPQGVFTSLAHYLTEEYLTASFRKLRKGAASGIDKVSYYEYEQGLEARIEDLHNRLRTGKYRAPDIRRVWIDKGGGKKRPLGISTIEDKIVQRAVTDILNGKAPTLDFLGFTHYWAISQKGKSVIKRRTSKKGLHKAIKNLQDSCRFNRHERIKEQYKLLCSKLRGLYQYYGIRGNFFTLDILYRKARRLWFYWLNRRSQHNSYTWVGYEDLLKHFALPRPRIIHWNV